MIDPELKSRLDEIEVKVEAARKAAESTRRYLFWTGVVTIALFVLPLLGLVFVIPMFINNYVTPINNAVGGTTSLQGTMSTLKLLGL